MKEVVHREKIMQAAVHHLKKENSDVLSKNAEAKTWKKSVNGKNVETMKMENRPHHTE